MRGGFSHRGLLFLKLFFLGEGLVSSIFLLHGTQFLLSLRLPSVPLVDLKVDWGAQLVFFMPSFGRGMLRQRVHCGDIEPAVAAERI